MSSALRSPIYWSFSGPDSWRLSVPQVSSAFAAAPALLEPLEQRAKPVAAGKDHLLFHQGEAPTGVFIVRKGTVKLTSQPDGDAILSVQVGPGSLLGLSAVIGEKPYSLTAKAMDGAEFSFLSCEDFIHLMQSDAALSFRVLQVLAEQVRFGREALSHL